MDNFTFLTKEQCLGEKKLDVLKKRGNKAALTDYAILFGAQFSTMSNVYKNKELNGRTGFYWTQSDNTYNSAWIVDSYGKGNIEHKSILYGGFRPILYSTNFKDILKKFKLNKNLVDQVLEVEYGYYPQNVVSKDKQIELENNYKKNELSKTLNKYTLYKKSYLGNELEYEKISNQEYENDGKRYVRLIVNQRFSSSYKDGILLSNGEKYQANNSVWVEVSPIKWLVDENSKILISDKILFGGVPYDLMYTNPEKKFEKSLIKKFMNECFEKDIKQLIVDKTYIQKNEFEKYIDIANIYKKYLKKEKELIEKQEKNLKSIER